MFKNIINSFRKRLEEDLRVLRYLFIEITQKCNLNCLHCGSDCKKDMRIEELSTKQWIDFINYLKDNFDPKELSIVVTGGEPLVRKDFFKIISVINKNGFRWGMVTNGYSYTKEVIEKTLDYGIRFLTISLDGLENNHNYLRNNKDSFKRAKNAIKDVSKYHQILFDIVTCVFPGNLNELNDIANLLLSQGVKRWRLFSIIAKGRASKNKNLILNSSQWKEMIEWIIDNRKRLKKMGLLLDFSCEGYFDQKIDNAIRDNSYFCRAGINIASVLCDGFIGACPNITRNLIQGHILKDDFKTVWENKYQKYINREWLKKGRCEECDQWKKCKGNSLHLYNDNFDTLEFCHYHDMTIE